MIKPTPCPICGRINDREYIFLEYWVQEEYYSCKACGYYSEMCASPTYEGFTIRADKSFRLIIINLFTQIYLLVKHRNKAWPIIRNNASLFVRMRLGIKSPSGRY